VAGAALALGGANCLLVEPDPDTHQWGRYALCLEKTFDTCDPGADAGCPAVARDDTRAASFRVDKPTSTLELTRDGVAAVTGRQGGARFEITGTTTSIDAQCGCWMNAVETFQGEFVGAATTCGPAVGESVDGGADAGPDLRNCVPEDVATDAGWTPGLVAGWVDEDEPVNFDTTYDGVTGRLVVDLSPAPDGGTCTCGPCRIEYRISGRR